MRINAFVALLVLALPASTYAQSPTGALPPPPEVRLTPSTVSSTNWNYGEIPWLSSKAEVKRILEQKGLAFTKTDEDGDLVFSGTLIGKTARLYAIFANDRLVKTSVVLITPDREARSTFRDMRETMITKYGRPESDFHFFTKPYYEGDGYEDQAIRVGKGHFDVFWTKTEGLNREYALHLGIRETLLVAVDYESPDWKAEYERRRARSTKDF
jgi:hypothetical protein